MADTINYKAKYLELKQNFVKAMDSAFSSGYQQGAKDEQMNQMQQQQEAQAQMQMQQQQQGGMGGDGTQEQMPGAEAESPEGASQEQANVDQNPNGSELDQHIQKLEGMLGKGELSAADLIKAVSGLKSFQKSQKEQADLKKSAQAIKGIATALHKPQFKFSQQANVNMGDNAKKAVSMQEKIVNDVMKAWDEEATKTSGDILSALGIEGLTTKE